MQPKNAPIGACSCAAMDFQSLIDCRLYLLVSVAAGRVSVAFCMPCSFTVLQTCMQLQVSGGLSLWHVGLMVDVLKGGGATLQHGSLVCWGICGEV